MVVSVDRVNAELPSGFPVKLADSILNGIRQRLRVLEAGVQEESSMTSQSSCEPANSVRLTRTPVTGCAIWRRSSIGAHLRI